MTLASVLALVVARRLGLRTRLIAQAETGALDLGDVRRIMLGVVAFSVLFEAIAAARAHAALRHHVRLLGRLGGLPRRVPRDRRRSTTPASRSGATTSCGSSPTAGSRSTISLAVIFGGIGFPVWLELRRQLRRPARWSLHTKLTLARDAVYCSSSASRRCSASSGATPATLGPLDTRGKLLAAFFQGVQPRTAGFNTVDYGPDGRRDAARSRTC